MSQIDKNIKSKIQKMPALCRQKSNKLEQKNYKKCNNRKNYCNFEDSEPFLSRRKFLVIGKTANDDNRAYRSKPITQINIKRKAYVQAIKYKTCNPLLLFGNRAFAPWIQSHITFKNIAA